MKTFIHALILCAILVIGSACNKGTLQPGGAYNPNPSIVEPDKAFYVADAAYKVAYTGITAIFDFERENRLLLWEISPDIKHKLDEIRPKAVEANETYLEARAVYKANPTPAGLTKLQTALSKLQQITSTVQTIVPQSNLSKP